MESYHNSNQVNVADVERDILGAGGRKIVQPQCRFDRVAVSSFDGKRRLSYERYSDGCLRNVRLEDDVSGIAACDNAS